MLFMGSGTNGKSIRVTKGTKIKNCFSLSYVFMCVTIIWIQLLFIKDVEIMIKNTDNLYNTCKNLTEDDISKLIIQSDSLEEKNFYRMVSDYFIQQKQKKVIEMGLF